MHLHLTGGRFFSQEAMACATGVAAGAAGAQGPQAFASLATTWASGGAAGAAADPNEPWKSQALREAMQALRQGPQMFADEHFLQRYLGKKGNEKHGWISIKEFVRALMEPPLLAEMRGLGLVANLRAEPSAGSARWQAAAIPATPWTDAEVEQARAALRGATWPALQNIYQPARDSAFEALSLDSLMARARVLQLALQLAQGEGRFAGLNAAVARGQAGMELSVWTDYHCDGNFHFEYAKTAGDMLQSFWCRLHLENMVDCFMWNEYQAAIAHWLRLPHLVLSDEVARQVSAWAVHPLADFQEMVALYLPATLLGAYMNVCCGYYQHFIKDGSERAICRMRDGRGLLRCDARASASHAGFCCWGHSANHHAVMRALCSFDATEYGLEYIGLRMGDKVILVDAGVAGEGWAHGRNLATGEIGWFPDVCRAMRLRGIFASFLDGATGCTDHVVMPFLKRGARRAGESARRAPAISY